MQLPEPRGEERHVLCGDGVLAPRAVENLRIGVGTRAGHDLEVLLEFGACDPALGRDDDPARPRINQPVDRHDS
jgi:hypothetical protein